MKTRFSAIAAFTISIAACSSSDSNSGGGSHDGMEQTTEGRRVVVRSDIVSDQPGALVTDETLVNAWGLAFNPMGVAWVAATETGWAEVYDAGGQAVIPPVAIPAADDPEARAHPTGQVFNADAEAFEGDVFILVTEDGTVAGWQPDTDAAVIRADYAEDGAIYKGAAIVENGNGDLWLLAADFAGRKVDVFDADYDLVAAADAYTDPDIPDDYAPFNVEAIEGWVLVTYAKQAEEGEDDESGAGFGYVSLFDTDGQYVTRLISEGELNSPWGAVLTPDTFDAAPVRLLIGNFGDGRILVYTLDTSESVPTATAEGPLVDSNGDDIVIDGLWALEFGPDAGGFSSEVLYFTAGPDGETHGVFGSLASAMPSTGGGGGSNGGGGGGY